MILALWKRQIHICLFVVLTEDLYIDDLEGMLFEGLLSLNTEVDDGSIEEVIPNSDCSFRRD